MSHFNFKKRNLFSGPHFVGMIIILAGVFALASPAFLESGSSLEKTIITGLGAVVVGSMIVSSYDGTLIDFSGKKVKEYFSFCGYKFGKWTSMPRVLKVKVVSTSSKGSNLPNGISPTLSWKVTHFTTLLYSDNPGPDFSFTYASKDKAIAGAQHLADHLNADLELNVREE